MAATVRILRGTTVPLAIAVLSLSSWAVAQQQTAPARPGTPRGTPGTVQQAVPQRVTANKLANDSAAATDTDRTIASWLAIGNLSEIAVSHYGASKVDNQDVRQFAEKMVNEHKELQKQLERFGASVMAFGEPNTTQRTGAGQARAAGQAALGQFAGEQRGGLNFLDVQRQIAERCVASAEKELNAKQGRQRDECFIGMQLGMHQHMIDTQKVLREHASPELQAVLDKSIASVESHLDHARHLIRDLVADQRDSKQDREK